MISSNLAQLTLEMCVVAENCQKITKTPYFGNLRSFRVIDVDTCLLYTSDAADE